jgi:hypothetical protein
LRERACKRSERDGKVRRGTAINAPWKIAHDTREIANRFCNRLLNGMVVPFIARSRNVPVSRDGDKASVLARAIVMDAARLFATPDHLFGYRLIAHRMGTAREILLAKSEPREPCRHAPCMHGLAGMGRASERNFLVADVKGLGRSRFEQRERLDGLEGGTRINRDGYIAKREDDIALRIGQGDGPAMHALHQRAAGQFDKYGIGHANLRPVTGGS